MFIVDVDEDLIQCNEPYAIQCCTTHYTVLCIALHCNVMSVELNWIESWMLNVESWTLNLNLNLNWIEMNSQNQGEWLVIWLVERIKNEQVKNLVYFISSSSIFRL